MSDKANGGPAFPVPFERAYDGISQRDWFAQNADLSGINLIMHREMAEALCGPQPTEESRALVEWHFLVDATIRYIAADAMLEARK